MDPSRFDGLARGIARFTSRRTTLAGLLAGLAVPLLGEGASEARKQRKKHRPDHDAGKKRHGGHHVDAEKKKKKKKCKPPTTKCGKKCFNTATDRANCGACSKACAAGEACKGGVCTCDGALCAGCCAGGVCRAGSSDQQCGADGAACAACPAGTSCVGGVCACGAGGACPAGMSCCSGACVNTQTDASHCDGCGNACPARETCRGGSCVCGAAASCAGGEMCCDDACADSESDYANCGACGHTCRANEICDSGACTCGSDTCAQDELCCDGATCSPIETDFIHCGSCGNACDAQTADACQDGNCTCGGLSACGPNQACCGGQCIDSTTVQNCGECGHTCDANEQCCGGQCVDTTTVQDCGACGHVCPGYGLPTADATCNGGNTCGLTCKGDNYDVDGDPENGCEASYTGEAHTRETAFPLGNVSCSNTDSVTPARTIYSDDRAHTSPTVPEFNTVTGAAPQWWVINATGGSGCDNDLDVKLTMTSGSGNCYRLTVQAGSRTPWTEQTVGGVAHVQQGAGSYADGDVISFTVEKTCAASVREAASYTIAYHL